MISMPYQPEIILDGQPVEKITAFLFPKGGHENPKVLLANAEKSFQDSIVLGMGFTFDDTNPEATSLAEMERLIAENPKNQERIFPYIGGSEVNGSPTHEHRRYVINFGEMSEEEARGWPELMAIVEAKVKPQRLLDKREIYRRLWWHFCEKRIALYRAIATCDRVLVISRHQPNWGLTFVLPNMVFSEALIVCALDTYSAFCALQSRPHEIWTRFFGSSLEDRLRYTPSDCFETFPFPENWETDPTLETIGKAYYDYRAALMIRNNQGLTDTYNRFHDPQETDPEIHHLRDLHSQMDQAVLTAYGWTEHLETDDQGHIPCGFALDYLDIETDNLPPNLQDRIASGDLHWADPAEAATFDNQIQASLKKRKKLPWRYRWPEAIHDEILARLLDLNQTRHEEEVLGHKAAKKVSQKGTSTKSKTKRTKSAPDPDFPTIPGLLDHD